MIQHYDLSDYNSICDFGGGQGAFLTKLLTNYSHIKGVVADLPGSTLSIEKTIAQAGLKDRCKAIPYDSLEDEPPICDAYFLVNILHDWEDEVCCRILKNISRSMQADSKLWIIEYLL